MAETSHLAVLDSDNFPTTRGSSVAQRIAAAVNTVLSLVPGLLCRLVTENSDTLSILHSVTVTVTREHNNVGHISTHFGI